MNLIDVTRTFKIDYDCVNYLEGAAVRLARCTSSAGL